VANRKKQRIGQRLVARILACVGLYGVVSYSVAQRMQEIGIRMSLGASSTKVLGLALGNALRAACGGVAEGLASALGLVRYLKSMFFGIQPFDPSTFSAVSLLLISIALQAAQLPARRASAIDPIAALRDEGAVEVR